MTNSRVVRHPAALLGLGFALAIWLVGGALSMTPAAAQACVGTVDAPAGKVCGLAIEAPANTLSATNATQIPAANARLARRIARFWTHFARSLDHGLNWRPYRATSAPGGRNIKILSTDSPTGALPVPLDPLAASNCAALWATQPPFTGSFPTQP